MKKILASMAIFFALSISAFAYSGDISINSQNIRFSDNNFLEGKAVRIYSTVTNLSNKDLLGVVRFTDNNSQISADQAVSIFSGKTDDIFIDWVPTYGTHKIAVKIYPWEPEIDDPSNNWIVSEIFAAQDTDHDGTPNDQDPDDDGDNVNDNDDAYPLDPSEQYDTDGDGVGDNKDEDDDNDGVPDSHDDLPLDPNETTDTDDDGTGNNADEDDDNDGLSDAEEENLKTNPINEDTDGDEYNDKEDAFPLNEKEWLDTDNDKIGNNMDTDDDNDGISDLEDNYPLNKGPVIKLADDNFNFSFLENVNFDASPSFDEDGNVVSFLWEIDGIQKEGNAITHKFEKLGKHSVSLTIKDDNGEIRTKNFQANVTNSRLYAQLALSVLAILLALLMYFKYIAEAKNSKK